MTFTCHFYMSAVHFTPLSPDVSFHTICQITGISDTSDYIYTHIDLCLIYMSATSLRFELQRIPVGLFTYTIVIIATSLYGPLMINALLHIAL